MKQLTLILLTLSLCAAPAPGQIQDRSDSCSLLPASARAQKIDGKGKTVALYMQLAGKNRDVDDAVKQHLESIGFQVKEIDQSEPAQELTKYSLVLLSSSVSARYLRYTLRDLPVPLMTWEFQMLDQLGMAGRRVGIDSGMTEQEHNLWMVNAPHPASGGLPPGLFTLYTKAAPMTWGKPGLGASILATLPGEPDKVAAFSYEKGATMDDESIAPERRLFFPLDDRTFTNLNSCGLVFFDSAVAWTAKLR